MSIGDGLKSRNQAPNVAVAQQTKVGFLTDPSLCIGCKACEVACKEYNQVPSDGFVWRGRSYDHSGELGHSTWRHVKFVEAPAGLVPQLNGGGADGVSWLFLSDVCKHCENAGCLEACPTGAILRNEVGAVYVQDDVCNGCGYCVVSCPFGVIERRPAPLDGAGGAYKCTLCYDRQLAQLTPACAKACPTESIQFGPLSELRERAARRLELLEERGFPDVRLYDPDATSVGGIHSLFITVGDPARFGLPPRPEVPTRYLAASWTSALVTALVAFAACLWLLGGLP